MHTVVRRWCSITVFTVTEQAKFIEDVFFNSMIIIQNHATLFRTYSTRQKLLFRIRLSTKVALSTTPPLTASLV
uniref:Uncharacterized protein n=1 Tax=Caenorhabditis japonica TaxID=281687 RepID=A0A8R1EP35_CAEJA